jgi:membrane associated rhomboid family serine protease
VSIGRSRARPPFELLLREGDELFELTRRGHYLLLSDDGLYLGRHRSPQRARFVSWGSITHLAAGRRSLWLGTKQSVRVIVHGRKTPLSFVEVGRKIEQRIARRPGGIEQLSRMREIDARAHRARVPIVSLLVVAVCVGLHLLQISDAFVSDVGIFARELVGEGELWRLVTPHFLHDVTWFFLSPEAAQGLPLVLRVPGHIASNCALALLLGYLVEQPLGRARTVFVLAASALGAVLVTGLASPSHVLGASGMVLGLAGAVLALEVSVPERLPATWRVPRALLVVVLLLSMVHSALAEYVAGWAHLGGFLGGYLAARLVARGAFREPPAAPWLRPAALAVGTCVGISFAAAAPLVLRMGWAFDRHAANVLALDQVASNTLNNLAWRIATETDGFPEAAPRALALAERAVAETERANPDYLDTLAEVQFLAGDTDAALITIDEAIEIAPWDDYFKEQRDRFIGLRPREDRPESPALPWYLRGPTDPPTWDDGTGLEI